MDAGNIVSSTLSLIAIILTIIMYFKHDKRLKKQEERLNAYQLKKIDNEESENKKAQIRGNIVNGEKGRSTLKVFNAGKSSATKIRLEFLSSTDGLYSIKKPFPYELLNPQDYTETVFQLTKGCPETIKVKFTWNDEFQDDNEFIQVLTL
ncbi:MAG: hypothetical protein ACRDCN_13645 [Tannerellaceae bacterium]